MTPATPQFRTYLRRLMIIVVAALLLIALANLLVDPFGAYRVAGSESFARYKSGMSTRNGKAEAIRRRPWDVVLLGNSRVEVGLDPLHTAWSGARVLNAGLAGTDFDELEQAARLAMQNANVKRIVLCVDLSDFDPTRVPSDLFLRSPLNPALNPIEYHLSNLLSLSAIEHTSRTLDAAIQNRPASPTPLGNSTTPLKTFGHADWTLNGYYDFADPEHRQISSHRTISRARVDALARLIADANQRHVAMDIVILPMHAVFFERLAASGEFELHGTWLEALAWTVDAEHKKDPAASIRLWSFCTYNPYTTEPCPGPGETVTNMHWFWDPVHFKKELGDLVIDRLISGKEDIGEKIDSSNVIQHLARLRDNREMYSNREKARLAP